MTTGCLADRLAQLAPLSAAEHAALDQLEERERHLRRGNMLMREHDTLGEFFIVRRGLLISYVLLDDGSRQIIDFLFPGDMIGLCGIVYNEAAESVMALGDSVVCPFDRAALNRVIVEFPRLSGMLMALGQIERVALTDRLAGLGRTSAKARVAALLLELRHRLAQGNAAIGDTYTLPLTQEEMGDAIGLTAVHVNRMLRQLEDEQLIRRENGRVTLVNERGLMRAGNFNDRQKKVDLNWLPPSR